VRTLLRLALAAAVATAVLLTPAVQAQEPGDLPAISLPITASYLDGDGWGTMTFEPGMQIMIYPPPPGQPIQVSLVQGGLRYQGAGRIYDPDAFGASPVSFTLRSPSGRSYQFEGAITSSGYGQGTYYPAGFPQRRYPWFLYLN
jgi:hypothetical protein